MGGTVVVNNDVGRTLQRKRATVVRAADVLDHSDGFRVGDSVYISFRTKDGSQFVVATGIVRCDAALLRETRTRALLSGALAKVTDDTDILIREEDVILLWPPKR
jgi:hypothetical protein